MPYSASVTRVAASNTPTNPGELGSATPNPMIPCSRNAPAAGTGRPKARKHTADAAAFTTHSTTDHAAAAGERARPLRAAGPRAHPPAGPAARPANAAGQA